MATPIIVANAALVRTRWSIAGQVFAETLNYVSLTTTLTSTLATNIANTFKNAWDTHLKASTHTAVTFTDVSVTDVRTATGPQFVTVYNIAGTLAGDPIPLQCAGLVAWYSALRGRRYRGRTYVGGFTEAGSLGVGPNAALQTALGNWATKLRTDLTTLGNGLLVASRLNATGQSVTSHTVRANWKTQRRRAG